MQHERTHIHNIEEEGQNPAILHKVSPENPCASSTGATLVGLVDVEVRWLAIWLVCSSFAQTKSSIIIVRRTRS